MTNPKAEYDAARYAANRDVIVERSRRYYHTNKAQIARRHRRQRYGPVYGITAAEYDRMYLAQGGLCAICEQPFAVLNVDHDHTTDTVRALLCHRCNVGIGFLQD